MLQMLKKMYLTLLFYSLGCALKKNYLKLFICRAENSKKENLCWRKNIQWDIGVLSLGLIATKRVWKCHPSPSCLHSLFFFNKKVLVKNPVGRHRNGKKRLTSLWKQWKMTMLLIAFIHFLAHSCTQEENRLLARSSEGTPPCAPDFLCFKLKNLTVQWSWGCVSSISKGFLKVHSKTLPVCL